jgi:Nucleotidyl transferase
MNQTYKLTAWIVASCLLASGSPPGKAAQPASVPSGGGTASGPSDEWGWPRQINSGGTTITIYQPQLDAWSGNQLTGRAAVAVQTAASASPTYGVIWFSARTEVDKQAGTVTLDSYQITKSSLPAATGGGPDELQLIRQNFGTVTGTLPIEQLEADLTVTQAENQQRRQPLRNDPPRILFSTTPAVLVLVDGQPALRQVAGTDLLRVINTRALILLDRTSGTYYLSLADRWMEASSLQGPWSPASHPPASLDKAKQAEVAAASVAAASEALAAAVSAAAATASCSILPLTARTTEVSTMGVRREITARSTQRDIGRMASRLANVPLRAGERSEAACPVPRRGTTRMNATGRMRKAIVMAGGQGKRLRPLTADRPKALVSIVNRPMLGYILAWMQGHGFTDVLITLQYRAEEIRRAVGEASERSALKQGAVFALMSTRVSVT